MGGQGFVEELCEIQRFGVFHEEVDLGKHEVMVECVLVDCVLLKYVLVECVLLDCFLDVNLQNRLRNINHVLYVHVFDI